MLVYEVALSRDPGDFASVSEKVRAWTRRQAQRERRRKWLIRIAVAALCGLWFYWVIRPLIRGTL